MHSARTRCALAVWLEYPSLSDTVVFDYPTLRQTRRTPRIARAAGSTCGCGESLVDPSEVMSSDHSQAAVRFGSRLSTARRKHGVRGARSMSLRFHLRLDTT